MTLDAQERERYGRQLLLPRIGEVGQQALVASRVVIVGSGALGCALGDLLARAGVGRIALVDRDFVERSNLSRQRLFSDADADGPEPKAVAAAARLSAINPQIEVVPHIVDLTADNVEGLLTGTDLVLDGTDNFATRFLLNDACLQAGIPWVYAGVVGTVGQTMAVRPGVTPCFSCYVAEPPPAGSYDTCDTAGVLGPAVDLVSALAATEGLKLLMGQVDALVGGITIVDCWRHTTQRLALRRRAGCPACEGRYRYLEAGRGRVAEVLCGRDAVMIPAPVNQRVDLPHLASQLAPLGSVRLGAYLLRFVAPEAELTVFADGRAVVKGVDGIERARAIYARYLG